MQRGRLIKIKRGAYIDPSEGVSIELDHHFVGLDVRYHLKVSNCGATTKVMVGGGSFEETLRYADELAEMVDTARRNPAM